MSRSYRHDGSNSLGTLYQKYKIDITGDIQDISQDSNHSGRKRVDRLLRKQLRAKLKVELFKFINKPE